MATSDESERSDDLGVLLASEIRRRRVAAGLSQPQLARNVGYTRQYVSLAERKGHNLPSRDLVLALDAALDARGVLVELQARAMVQRRACRVSGDRPAVGLGTGEPVGEASTEAAELISVALYSDVTSDAVEHCALTAAALAESHARIPARNLLREVLRLHERVQKLLIQRLRLSQRRELYRIESDLLAHACLLLGDVQEGDVAESYGLSALTYAREAGSSQAAARSALAKNLRWQNRLIESADMARRGFGGCGDVALKVQLASQEANAAALVGDHLRAQEALRRSGDVAEEVDCASGSSAWSFPIARQVVFAQSVANQAGNPDAALRATIAADEYWASGGQLCVANWAHVRVGAGRAYLVKGDALAAMDEVLPVLTMRPEMRVATVTEYVNSFAVSLAAAVSIPCRIAAEMQERCRAFAVAALPVVSE